MPRESFGIRREQVLTTLLYSYVTLLMVTGTSRERLARYRDVKSGAVQLAAPAYVPSWTRSFGVGVRLASIAFCSSAGETRL